MANLSDRERLKNEVLKEENEEEDAAAQDDVDEKDRRIFINHLDSYQGKNLARVSSISSKSIYGSTIGSFLVFCSS